MQNERLPRVGYDNVAFEADGIRVVATVLGIDDKGRLIAHNTGFDELWHVRPDQCDITAELENEPPADQNT